jgi:alpha-ketoglutarate-dependent 2,4-dichlorophenoxyacetate dioxygenase
MDLTFRKLHPHFVEFSSEEHATQPPFVYRHAWRVGDLVIWDNRATMHRARPFDDTMYRRELRRVTTLDIEPPLVASRT